MEDDPAFYEQGLSWFEVQCPRSLPYIHDMFRYVAKNHTYKDEFSPNRATGWEVTSNTDIVTISFDCGLFKDTIEVYLRSQFDLGGRWFPEGSMLLKREGNGEVFGNRFDTAIKWKPSVLSEFRPLENIGYWRVTPPDVRLRAILENIPMTLLLAQDLFQSLKVRNDLKKMFRPEEAKGWYCNYSKEGNYIEILFVFNEYKDGIRFFLDGALFNIFEHIAYPRFTFIVYRNFLNMTEPKYFAQEEKYLEYLIPEMPEGKMWKKGEEIARKVRIEMLEMARRKCDFEWIRWSTGVKQ